VEEELRSTHQEEASFLRDGEEMLSSRFTRPATREKQAGKVLFRGENGECRAGGGGGGRGGGRGGGGRQNTGRERGKMGPAGALGVLRSKDRAG